MIEIRRLTPNEYGRLSEVGEGFTPNPQNSITLVAEDEGQIVGRMFLVEPVHIEGPWIKESHRGGSLLKRLVWAAEKELKKLGASKVFAYAVDSQIEDYLKRLGFKKWDVTVWEKVI